MKSCVAISAFPTLYVGCYINFFLLTWHYNKIEKKREGEEIRTHARFGFNAKSNILDTIKSTLEGSFFMIDREQI